MSYGHRGQRYGMSGDPGPREPTFEEWTASLRAAGFQLCPRSCAVPVELRGLRPDGFGFHLRCRGVRVKLSLFRPGRAMWQLPFWDPQWVPEEGLSLWANYPMDHPSLGHRPFGHPAPSGLNTDDGTHTGNPMNNSYIPNSVRMVFDHGEAPDHQVVFDGGQECGWRGHEAGLLRPAAAATFFARLMREADPATDLGSALLVPRARVGEPIPMQAAVE